MNFLENLNSHSEIYKKLGSKEAHKDFTKLPLKEYYQKYYWFLPQEIIDNIDNINDSINKKSID